MANDIFSDGFGAIAVTGPLVRIDLISMAGRDKDGKPVFEKRGNLVLPLEGFLRSVGAAEAIVNKLIADGVVQKREPDSAAPASAPNPPKSPNFS